MNEKEKYIPPEAKQELWDKLSNEVEQIADRLGHKVDDGIKETIIAFKAFEIPTSGSCEGHTEGEHGLPYPWVDIEVEEPEGWKDNEIIEEQWKKQNLVERQKMMALLDEFYKTRSSPIDARLIFENHGIYGAFRLHSMGAETMELLSEEDLKTRSALYQNEMKDFTEFLKKKHFS